MVYNNVKPPLWGYLKNIFIAETAFSSNFNAQKLTKLEHFKEIYKNVIEKIQKLKSTNVCWSFFDSLRHFAV